MILIFVATGVVAGFVAGVVATLAAVAAEERHRDALALSQHRRERRALRQVTRHG